MWVYSAEEEDKSNHIINTVPQYVTVLPVYEEASFSGLGI